MGCCSRGRRFPTKTRMAKNFASSMAQTFKHAASTGEVTANPATVAKRIEICESCENKSGIRCLECGCFIRLKAALATSKCPIGKW